MTGSPSSTKRRSRTQTRAPASSPSSGAMWLATASSHTRAVTWRSRSTASADQIEAPRAQRSWVRRVRLSRMIGAKSRTKIPEFFLGSVVTCYVDLEPREVARSSR